MESSGAGRKSEAALAKSITVEEILAVIAESLKG